MRQHWLAAAASAACTLIAFGTTATQAQEPNTQEPQATQIKDLQWQVENPFRFFKSTRAHRASPERSRL
jgi:hypothetical protein